MAQKMHKVGKLNSSIDIIPLQGTSDSVIRMGNPSDFHCPRDPRIPRDPLIVSRVQTYMYENEDQVYIDVNEMADTLQKRYRDYQNKKRSGFRAMVRRAYDEITESFGKTSDGSMDEDDDEVEVEAEAQSNPLSREMIKFYKKKRDGQNGSTSDKELINISSDEEGDKHSVDGGKKRREHSAANKSDFGSSSHVNITKAAPSKVSGDMPAPSTSEKSVVPEDDVRTKKRPREKSDDGNTVTKKKKNVAATKSTESKVKFANLGGSAKVLETVCRLLVHMRHPEIFRQLGISSPRGFLLHGPPGCGKTLLAHAIAGELGVPLIKVAAPELIAGVSGESESRIRELFEKAVAVAPCVLFLDEVDAIASHRATAQREMERRIVAQLLSCLDDLSTKVNGETVLVLGATNRPEALDPALRRAGRFDREISLGIPDKAARRSILAIHAAKLKLADDVDLAEIAAITPGFVGADIVALLTEAAMTAVNRVFDILRSEKKDERPEKESVPEVVREAEEVQAEKNMQGCSNEEPGEGENAVNGDDDVPPVEAPEVQEDSTSGVAVIEPESTTVTPPTSNVAKDTDPDKLEGLLTWLHNDAPLSPERLAELRIERADFHDALKVVQPSSKREGFATVPDVTWDDVGSLRNIRQELQMAILAPIRHSERFEAFGLSSPTGVMLCGPPGCGKTLLAKAIANEAGINFISVKGPELLNMYVGESEKAVRQCFVRARNSAPCVIFFDELDALCPKRSDGDNSATSRVVNQMLTEMDGVEGRKGVYLMAASNRPDMIDPAVLRPGRLDKILYVGLPTASDRVDILKALTKNGTKPRFGANVDLEDVAKSANCDGYSGADLSALVREAATEALRESMTESSQESTDITEISIRHINVAFDKVKPSVQDKDAKHYEKLRKLYAPTRNSPEITPMDTPVDAPMTDATMEAMET